MSYDVILSRASASKVVTNYDRPSPAASATVERQMTAAIIHPLMDTEPVAPTHINVVSSTTPNTTTTSTMNTGTPARRTPTSSRFMSALTNFYANEEAAAPIVTSSLPNSARGTPVKTAASAASASTILQANTGEEIKGKLMSMWHNVKYGWGGKIQRSNFSKEQPVWLLGRCYHRKFSPVSSMENSAEFGPSLESKWYCNEPSKDVSNDGMDPTVQEFGTDAIEGQCQENPWEEGIEGFKRDFQSRLWMTYRREFPILNGSNYTSDCGWGCMLRSGQMLLAQALVCHFLGRGWRWDEYTQLHSTHEDTMHRKIVRWFGDNASRNSPFSIHTLVTLGQEAGKKPGDWYGPSSVSHLLRQAVQLAAQENADLDDINVCVAQDCTVYIQDILDECLVPHPGNVPAAPWQQAKSPTDNGDLKRADMHWKSLILLVPLRLGAEKLNPIYGNTLKALLATEYCIGIIGGRPKHSLYFVGFQEDKLIHLDPHYCQEMVDVNQDNFSMTSFHCKSPRKIKLAKMDPSCCIGFYCPTRADFDNFVGSVQPYLLPVRLPSSTSPSNNSGSSPNNGAGADYPMFVFSRGRSTDQQCASSAVPPASLYQSVQMQLNQMQQQEYADDDDDLETEEFVIL